MLGGVGGSRNGLIAAYQRLVTLDRQKSRLQSQSARGSWPLSSRSRGVLCSQSQRES